MHNLRNNVHSTDKNKTKVNGNIEKSPEDDVEKSQIQEISMTSLIKWNVTKALEKNPCLDLKSAIKAAQDRLDQDACDLLVTVAQCPEEQHLVCAFLAWQQLGHANTDSLHEFIISQADKKSENNEMCNLNRKKSSKSLLNRLPKSINMKNKSDKIPSGDIHITDFGPYSKGPVIKLPVETKIVMRCDTHRNQSLASATTSKIEAACCKDTACTDRLVAMDAATEELRARVAKLANREAQRVILLERAEAAWSDLERGYQRRLVLAEDKENDISRQIQKLIADRNINKDACTALASQLKEAGDAAYKEQHTLKEVEKELCSRACARIKLGEEVARAEAAITNLQCKVVLLDRDLQFKEEQARRKLLTIDSETESARLLTCEAERALRAELSGLQKQIEQVSVQLLEEDEVNKRIKDELEQLREEKSGMVEDLDGCKAMCDSKMQSKLNEIKNKKEQLEKLKEKVIDCQCRVPVDASVTAKRTPSLAALCNCAPEDRFLESCSCTSLRSSLLSTLLADLFGGLQSELSEAGLLMPCQLLKCLENNHNWDRSSVVKTNLRNFFSQLLVGELDIAIATSIENYHAKWVGASCADETRLSPEPKDDLKEGWEKRALERRAQKLATELAEQLFEKRAEELKKKAKEIVASGPPPCECKMQKHSENASVLSCLTETNTPFVNQTYSPNQSFNRQTSGTKTGLEVTQQDVTDLKLQIEDLKKETIKKEDLRLMEEKIAQLVKNGPALDNENDVTKDIGSMQQEINKEHPKLVRYINIHESPQCTTCCKTGCGRRKLNDTNCAKKFCSTEKPIKQPKRYNHHQSYAVNLCLCGPGKVNKTLANSVKPDVKSSLKHKTSKEILHQVSRIRRTAPINLSLPPPESKEVDNKLLPDTNCKKKCKCLNKVPSTSSIDRLVATLNKFKNALGDSEDKIKNRIVSKYLVDKSCQGTLGNEEKDDTVVCFSKRSLEMEHNKNRIKCNALNNYHSPTNSPSIYMAAINLDKSNDLACKSIITTDFKAREEQAETNKSALGVYTNQYKQPRISEKINIYNNEDKKKIKVLNEHLYDKIKNSENVNVINNSETMKCKTDENQKKSESKNNISTRKLMPNSILNEPVQSNLRTRAKNVTDVFTNMRSQPEIPVQNFDYTIKFLGVTLADIFCEEHQVMQDNCTRPSKRLKKSPQKQNDNISNKETKCGCNSKLEKCRNFTYKIVGNKQINDIQEQCICCNSNRDSSKDLEENAFHLLEDHLKEKLRELKNCTCEASCILPEEEEKIFSTILKKVREVISNCANEFKATEPEGSWKRAYGLLKEYLKHKIKRVQGLPLTTKRTQEVLPDILNKVCNLIEKDFQRLKEICKCNNHDKSCKKNVNGNMFFLSDFQEFPEKDTNISNEKPSHLSSPTDGKVNINQLENIQNISCQVYPNFWMKTKSCDAISESKSTDQNQVRQQMKENTTESCIVRDSVSAQVPPDLGMKIKMCNIRENNHNIGMASKSGDIIEINDNSKNMTPTNYIMPQSNSVCANQELINNSFGGYQYPKSEYSEILNPCINKELLLNLYADVLINCDVMRSSKSTMNQNFNIGFVNSLPNLNKIQFLETITTTKKHISTNIETLVNRPYFGCTRRCTCGDDVSYCVCIKSIFESNNNGHDHNNNDWLQFIASNNKTLSDWPYIFNRRKKVNLNITELNEGNHNKDALEFNTHTKPEENADLKVSKQTFNTCCHSKNTIMEIITLDNDAESGPICSQLIQNGLKCTENLKISQKSSENLIKSSEKVATVDTVTLSQKCDCDKVPVCHVKMLVENIERRLLESKCTCDSIFRVCPLHSGIII